MHLTIKALVLRVTPYGDHDAFLTLLSPNHGKLSAKVRNLRRKNSVLSAPCQLLAYGEFTLFEYRGSFTVNEAHSIALFQQLRRDLTKLSLGTYFAQVADILSQEDLPNPELLSLLLNSLHMLCLEDVSVDKVKAVFELRAACLAGYTPDLSGCYICGEPYSDQFDVSQGHLQCHHCRGNTTGGIRMPVTPGVLDSMRYISQCDPKKLFSFQNEQDTYSILSAISETYLTTQLERSFSALDFYKSLLTQEMTDP